MEREQELVPGLGQAVFVLREGRGLTQHELADELGTTNVYLCNIERGRRAPSLPLLVKLVGVLGTTLADLFTEAARLAPNGKKNAG